MSKEELMDLFFNYNKEHRFDEEFKLLIKVLKILRKG